MEISLYMGTMKNTDKSDSYFYHFFRINCVFFKHKFCSAMVLIGRIKKLSYFQCHFRTPDADR